MEKIIATWLLFACFSIPVIAADNYIVDSKHTFPGFEIRHFGFSTQYGRFNKTTGKLTLDLEVEIGNLNIEINADSISTGSSKLDDLLRSEDFLDVKKYPKIIFRSMIFNFVKNQLDTVDGQLTMHGITKNLQLKIYHFYCGINPIWKTVCGANASGSLKRSDFGINKYTSELSDDVRLFIQIEARRY